MISPYMALKRAGHRFPEDILFALESEGYLLVHSSELKKDKEERFVTAFLPDSMTQHPDQEPLPFESPEDATDAVVLPFQSAFDTDSES
jgi:hypothetical protein